MVNFSELERVLKRIGPSLAINYPGSCRCIARMYNVWQTTTTLHRSLLVLESMTTEWGLEWKRREWIRLLKKPAV